MAITNLYKNLPGHLVEFKDGGMQLRDTEVLSNTKSLLILGTAVDGPVNEPVAVDVENAHKLFGKDVDDNGKPNGATLIKAARQAFKAGFDDIRLMRVTGSIAQASLETNVVTSEEVLICDDLSIQMNGSKAVIKEEIKSDDPSINAANNIYAVYPLEYIIVKPEGAESDQSNLQLFEDYNIIHDNTHTANAGFSISLFENKVSAKNNIEIDFKTEVIDLDNTETVSVATLDSVDASHNVTIDFDLNGKTPYLYEFNNSTYSFTDHGTVKDFYGVPVKNGLVQVKLEENKVGYIDLVTALTPVGDIVLENGHLKITFNDATEAIDPADNSTFDGTDYEIEFVACELSNTNNQVVIAKSDFFDAQSVTVIDADKEPVADEEVTIQKGDYVIAKLGDENLPGLTYDADTMTFSFDPTAVASSVPASYIASGSELKVVYKYIKEYTESDKITFKSSYGGTNYNNCKVIVDVVDGGERIITLVKPSDKKFSDTEQALSYSTADYRTFAQLKDAIDNDPLNNVFSVDISDDDALVSDIPVPGGSLEMSFAGGKDGLNPTNDELFVALSGLRNSAGELTQIGAYQILENYHVDFVYPAGAYANAKISPSISKNSFHDELATLCFVLTYRTKMTHGFIDVKPNSDTSLVGVQNYVDSLLQYENVHFLCDYNGTALTDEDGKPIDIGKYTSCVVGPDLICTSPTLGTYFGSPAIAYAALNANIKAQSAPTNKQVPGCSGMRFKFSNKQLNELVENRFVVFTLKNEGANNASNVPFVVDGCTSSLPDSDYARISTIKVVTKVVDGIREVADPFLGEPNTDVQRNALAAQVSKLLSRYCEEGIVLNEPDFEIIATIQMVLVGECKIRLTLVPPQELRKITTVVSLKAGL